MNRERDEFDDFRNEMTELKIRLMNTPPEKIEEFKKANARELWKLDEMLIFTGQLNREDAEDWSKYLGFDPNR